jgi:hypothetical protein
MTSPTAQLTRRERDILRCEGMPARQVAVALLMPVGEVLEFRHRLRARGFAPAR